MLSELLDSIATLSSSGKACRHAVAGDWLPYSSRVPLTAVRLLRALMGGSAGMAAHRIERPPSS